MSITYKCNRCGETIDRDAPLVILTSDGERSANQWRSGWIGHYHADPAIGCWQRILHIIRAADGWAPSLDAIRPLSTSRLPKLVASTAIVSLRALTTSVIATRTSVRTRRSA